MSTTAKPTRSTALAKNNFQLKKPKSPKELKFFRTFSPGARASCPQRLREQSKDASSQDSTQKFSPAVWRRSGVFKSGQDARAPYKDVSQILESPVLYPFLFSARVSKLNSAKIELNRPPRVLICPSKPRRFPVLQPFGKKSFQFQLCRTA